MPFLNVLNRATTNTNRIAHYTTQSHHATLFPRFDILMFVNNDYLSTNQIKNFSSRIVAKITEISIVNTLKLLV